MSASIVIALWLSTAAQLDAGVAEHTGIAPAEAMPAPATRVEEGSPAPLPRTFAGQPTSHWYDMVTLGGFARIGLFYDFPFRDQQLVGGNGGFRLADARLSVGFKPVHWANFVFSIDAAAPVPNDDPTTGTRIVSLADWYADLRICKGFLVRAGQFRPPYYAEMLQPDGMLPFVSRSVVSEGEKPPDAFGPRKGVVIDRQPGVMAYSERLGGETIGFRWAAGVFNGNGPNQLFNDNNAVMPVVRAEVDVAQKVTLAVNALYNVRADGTRPNQVTVNQFGYGADLVVAIGGVHAIVGFVGNQYTYGSSVLPPDSNYGFMGQVHYLHDGTGLEAAVRFALLEPSTAQIDDRVDQFSAMIGYRPFNGPVRIVLEYDHRDEETAVAIANDSLTLFLHAFF